MDRSGGSRYSIISAPSISLSNDSLLDKNGHLHLSQGKDETWNCVRFAAIILPCEDALRPNKVGLICGSGAGGFG